MNELILLGAPGAGKGTQAEMLSEKLNIPIISTGNILKQAIREGTPLGLEAASFINEGNLVPDPVIIGIVKARLAEPDCEAGYILDGVPRTIAQAEALSEMGVNIDAVISLEVSDEAIINRMSGRVICSLCGSSYHLVSKKPQVDGVCDRCGGALVTRPDDAPETVLKRLVAYHEQTEPLKAYYAERGLLREVQGEAEVHQITQNILSVLGVE